ncbi:hypothetical protein AB6A40_003731 [Gnathostoma spinigerum]|uniref:CWF19-like protein 2 n=1 Tax=Gnathostoma spinigerum TaxID=75299 RepID=A0ABD6ECM7_9BILA
MWEDHGMDCVFVETAKNVKERCHMFIECIPLSKECGATAPMFFKEAINNSETEWSDNKKLLKLADKNGDIRRLIPKGFSYFSIDFGLQPGYVHIIEDEHRFQRSFAHECIAGMLDIEHDKWRKTKVLSNERLKECRNRLIELWSPYDWTEVAKRSIRGQDNKEPGPSH